MPKVTPGINNFNGGEVSPLLDTRWDLSKYGSSCKAMQNALPLVEGGAKKMPGTYYVTRSNDDGKSRLVPFSFSTDQAYVLEFSDQKVRIFTDDGLLPISAPPPVTTTAYDPSVTYVQGDYVTVGDYWTFDVYNSDTDEFRTLRISGPYGQSFPYLQITVRYLTVGWDVFDTMIVNTIAGPTTQQMIIFLAGNTHSKNAADLIQAAIRAKGSVGGYDLTEFVVIPSDEWYAEPPSDPSITQQYMVLKSYPTTHQEVYQALEANQYSYFPPSSDTKWEIYELDESQVAGDGIELVTPYLEADLFDLDVSTQSADVLYIFHNAYEARTIQRHSATHWTIGPIEFTGTRGPTKVGYNGSAIIISAVSQANPCVLTSIDEHRLEDNDIVYLSGMDGMPQLNGNRYTVSKISSTQFSVNVDSTNFEYYLGGGYAAKIETLFNVEGEYPGCGTFYEQRLMLSGFVKFPRTVVGSVSGDYYNYTADPSREDYSPQFDLAGPKVDPVVWMASQSKLALGTASGVWIVSGANGEPLSGTSIEAKRQITIGASNLSPQVVNDTLVWFTRVARTARILQYVWNTDQWISPDLTRIARHIMMGPNSEESGIVQTAFQQEPYPILWAVRKDGVLLGMTYESQEQVYGWFRIVTNGRFESIAVVPRPNQEDRVWVIVNRSEA